MKTAVRVKTPGPARKTNNQASFGGSLLKNNMEVEAAMELQRHLDETGLHRVYTNYASGYFRFAPFMLEGVLGLHMVQVRCFRFS